MESFKNDELDDDSRSSLANEESNMSDFDFHHDELADDLDRLQVLTGTFGKYCEYQLTHDSKKFSEAVKRQFEQNQDTDDDSWNTQRYGKFLCYETLPCSSSPLCIGWREICDGIQRCSNGVAEENCDKLEFNECDDDESRCENGMCISQEFWLDGETDEYFVDRGTTCPFQANAMECDENLCSNGLYSCGDGQCIAWETRMAFQRLGKAQKDCFNKRNINYMCELSQHRPT
ncbi:unnamed protein product [Rotaria magnacalcarata]|uniref:Uncharacterized protein n=1 Tax=Rotaria magnacalcarata TaxID=392030 RepID=A0A819JVA7_9BILA|nr:unnamed protein product [Rotaria magnacalcarata]